MGLPAPKVRQSPYNIWNALLAPLVYFRIGEVLQPLLTSEEVGSVALSCHFACDALRLGSGRAWLTSELWVKPASLPTPQRRSVEGSPGWGNGAPARCLTCGVRNAVPPSCPRRRITTVSLSVRTVACQVIKVIKVIIERDSSSVAAHQFPFCSVILEATPQFAITLRKSGGEWHTVVQRWR